MRSSASMSGYSARDLAEAVEKEAVGQLHDVRFVDRRDALSSVAAGVFECVPRDPRRGVLRDDLDRLDDTGDDDMLEAAVEILRVLADHHEVHVLEPARDGGHVLDRTEVRVEVERLAQPDVDGREPLSDRSADGPLQRDAVLPDRIENALRQRVALRLLRRAADDGLLERERRGRGFEDRDDGVGDFGSHPVAPDERDGAFGHGGGQAMPRGSRPSDPGQDIDRLHAGPSFFSGRIMSTLSIPVGLASSI